MANVNSTWVDTAIREASLPCGSMGSEAELNSKIENIVSSRRGRIHPGSVGAHGGTHTGRSAKPDCRLIRPS
jgi:hypothetical protein